MKSLRSQQSEPQLPATLPKSINKSRKTFPRDLAGLRGVCKSLSPPADSHPKCVKGPETVLCPCCCPGADDEPTLDDKPSMCTGQGLWSRETRTSGLTRGKGTPAMFLGKLRPKTAWSSVQMPLESHLKLPLGFLQSCSWRDNGSLGGLHCHSPFRVIC